MASAFLRKVTTLSSGIALSQGLLFLAMPVLSRVYSPEDFGLLGILVALTSVLAVVSNGRYFLAIVQPEDDNEAATVLGLSLSTTTVFTVVVALLLWLTHPLIARLVDNPEFSRWWWWVPLGVALAGWFDAVNYWHIRADRYGLVAKIQPLRALVLTASQLGLGLMGFGPAGLLQGRLLADGVLIGGLVPRLGQDLRGGIRLGTPATWWRAAVQHRSFPLFSAPQGLLSAVAQYLPVFVLAIMVDETAVGAFLMSQRILATPNQFLGKALRQTFYQQLHQPEHDATDQRRFWSRTTRTIVLWSLAPALLLALVGPWLFPLILGADWNLAGQFSPPMVIWQMLALASIPSQMLLMAQGRQQVHLVIEVIFLVARLVGMLVGHEMAGAVGAVAGYSLAAAGMHIVILLAARRPILE